MPAPEVASGSIVEITLQGLNYSTVNLTVLHYRYINPSAPLPLDEFYEQLNTIFSDPTFPLLADYVACCSEFYSLRTIVSQVISPIRYIRDVTISPTPLGQVIGPMMPPGVASSITKQGIIANRHNIGGVRMPGVPVSFVTEGYLNNDAKIAYNALADHFATPFTMPTGAVMQPVIFNRQSPNDSVDVFHCYVQETSRTMYRRVVGRGI